MLTSGGSSTRKRHSSARPAAPSIRDCQSTHQGATERASGSTIKVTLQYEDKGKTVTVSAKEWIRNFKTMKPLDYDWVFGGTALWSIAPLPQELIDKLQSGTAPTWFEIADAVSLVLAVVGVGSHRRPRRRVSPLVEDPHRDPAAVDLDEDVRRPVGSRA